MKIALVKQLLDTHGPWRTIAWAETSPAGMLRHWPGRALFWAMTVLLKADWYVILQQQDTWYTRMSGVSQPPDRAVIERHSIQVCQPAAIPWEAYDVVISLDPCLRPPQRSRTLFAYYMNEHEDVLYTVSQRKVLHGYDLFLDHRLSAMPTLAALPQPLAFPYLWESAVTRPLVQAKSGAADAVREEGIFMEWRTLAILAGDPRRQSLRFVQRDGSATLGLSEAEAAPLAARLARYLGLPVRYRLQPDGVYNRLPDPPHWGELLDYLGPYVRCRYYVSLFAYGAGQALVDAAAMGALVFGHQTLPYHRLLCHPACLCTTLDELPQRLRRVQGSPNLQAEALAWQGTMLQKHFGDQPRQLLAEAVSRKRNSA